MVEEVLDITNLEVLGDDEVGLEMKLVSTNDYNDPAPESAPESTNQEEAVYNVDWVPRWINTRPR